MLSKIIELIDEQQNNKTETEITFKLPINYIEDKYPIEDCIKNDLELLPTENTVSLYENIFLPTSQYANKITSMWSEYYTPNKIFLKDSQYFIKNFSPITQPSIEEINNIHDITL